MLLTRPVAGVARFSSAAGRLFDLVTLPKLPRRAIVPR